MWCRPPSFGHTGHPACPPLLWRYECALWPHPPRGGWPHTLRVWVSECHHYGCEWARGSGWEQRQWPTGVTCCQAQAKPHLAGWHQHHCCPVSLISCLLRSFVFHLCICLNCLFFSQSFLNSTVTVYLGWWLSSSLPRSVLGKCPLREFGHSIHAHSYMDIPILECFYSELSVKAGNTSSY